MATEIRVGRHPSDGSHLHAAVSSGELPLGGRRKRSARARTGVRPAISQPTLRVVTAQRAADVGLAAGRNSDYGDDGVRRWTVEGRRRAHGGPFDSRALRPV